MLNVEPVSLVGHWTLDIGRWLIVHLPKHDPPRLLRINQNSHLFPIIQKFGGLSRGHLDRSFQLFPVPVVEKAHRYKELYVGAVEDLRLDRSPCTQSSADDVPADYDDQKEGGCDNGHP